MTPPSPPVKPSYTVPCASAFRDRVMALARRRHVNAADLARSVLILLPPEAIDRQPDPGEPEAEDREPVVLKSGPAAGRPWRRKPRLQLRLPAGLSVPLIRKALALALAMEAGELHLNLDHPSDRRIRAEALDELERLQTVLSVLAFEPLPDGVRTRAEALHVLGFPPGAHPDPRKIKAKFRLLATIHHPDSKYGSHQRMSQLNSAMDLLARS